MLWRSQAMRRVRSFVEDASAPTSGITKRVRPRASALALVQGIIFRWIKPCARCRRPFGTAAVSDCRASLRAADALSRARRQQHRGPPQNHRPRRLRSVRTRQTIWISRRGLTSAGAREDAGAAPGRSSCARPLARLRPALIAACVCCCS